MLYSLWYPITEVFTSDYGYAARGDPYASPSTNRNTIVRVNVSYCVGNMDYPLLLRRTG
jgi:hypothetical protein